MIAAVSDLFFRSKIAETASLLGTEVKFFSAEEAGISAEDFELFIIDLMQNGALDLIKKMKLRGLAVVGYLPHIEKEKRKEAEDAGCIVYSRSEFSSKVADIIRIAKGA